MADSTATITEPAREAAIGLAFVLRTDKMVKVMIRHEAKSMR